MKLDFSTIFSLLSIIFVIISFALNRKDKSSNDVGKEQYKMGALEAKIDNIGKQLDKISVKLDRYDKEIDERIDLRLRDHVRAYHGDNK